MNSIITKLKTSATLWSAIGSFVVGVCNLIWGDGSVASTIASTAMIVIPIVVYIISKFVLRIKMADTNGDGTVSLPELATALNAAVDETSDEAEQVLDAFRHMLVSVVAADVAAEPDEEDEVETDGQEG